VQRSVTLSLLSVFLLWATLAASAQEPEPNFNKEPDQETPQQQKQEAEKPNTKASAVWNLVDLKRIRWEGPDALASGRHTLEFDFKYEGMGSGTMAFRNYNGIGQGGTGVLKVDGKEVSTQKMDHSIPFILQFDESLDVGSDTLTGVNDANYQPPFTFTGEIDKITLTIDRPKLSPADIQKLQQAERDKGVTRSLSSSKLPLSSNCVLRSFYLSRLKF